MEPKLSLEWFRGVPEDKKDDLRQFLFGNRDNFRRLAKIIAEKSESTERIELDPAVFEDPNWAFKQAYYNGVQKAYNDVLELLRPFL